MPCECDRGGVTNNENGNKNKNNDDDVNKPIGSRSGRWRV